MDLRRMLGMNCLLLASVCSAAFAAEDDHIVDAQLKLTSGVQEQVRFIEVNQPVGGVVRVARKEVQARPHLAGQFGLKPARIFEANVIRNLQPISGTDYFDQCMFGSGNSVEKEKSRRQQQLERSIANIDRACQLTADQKQKLELIGRSQRKQVFDQIEDLRSKYSDRILVGNERAQLQIEIKVLRTKLYGALVDEESFFQKSLRTILTDEQCEKYRMSHAERRGSIGDTETF